jgi:hypothetical protein
MRFQSRIRGFGTKYQPFLAAALEDKVSSGDTFWLEDKFDSSSSDDIHLLRRSDFNSNKVYNLV